MASDHQFARAKTTLQSVYYTARVLHQTHAQLLDARTEAMAPWYKPAKPCMRLTAYQNGVLDGMRETLEDRLFNDWCAFAYDVGRRDSEGNVVPVFGWDNMTSEEQDLVPGNERGHFYWKTADGRISHWRLT